MTRARVSIALAVLLFAAYLLRSTAFEAGFAFDDIHTISDNPAIRVLSPVSKFFAKGAEWFSTLNDHRSYRPLTTLSYAVDYARAGKLDPRTFHTTTFVLAALEALLLFGLTRRAYAALVPTSDGRLFALVCVAMRLFHGANPETLNYHSSRSDVFSSLFVLAGLWTHAAAPRLRNFELGALVASVGILAKEPAAVYPGMLGLWVLLVERAGWLAAARRALPALLICGGVFWWTRTMQGAAMDFGRSVDVGTYATTQAWVILRYVGFFFAPIDASIDHDQEMISSIADPRFLAGAASILALVVFSLWATRRGRGRLFAFGAFWFLVALLPSSSVYPLHEARNDHRVFFPYAGLVVAVAAAGAAMIARVATWAESAGEGRVPKRVGGVIVACAVLAHAGWAARRNFVWESPDRLWDEALRTSPNSSRVWMNAGLRNLARNDVAGALRRFERSHEINPRSTLNHINLAIAHDAKKDQVASDAWFAKAAAMAPKEWRVPYWRGVRLMTRGEPFEASASFRLAKALEPRNLQIRVGLAKALAAAELPVPLYECVDETNAIFPNDPAIAAAAAAFPEPVRIAARAAAGTPPSAEAYAVLSAALFRSEKYVAAVDAARVSVGLDPKCASGWNNLGAALGSLGRFAEEIDACRKALEIEPSNALAARNLAWAEEQLRAASRPTSKPAPPGR